MHPFLRWAGLIVAAVVVLPVLAADDPKADEKKPADKGDPKSKLENQEKEKYISLGQLVGTLTNLGSGDQMTMTLRVTWKYAEPNLQAQADLVRQQQDLIRRQGDILRNPNYAQRQQQLVQLMMDAARMQQQAGKNLFTIKEQHKDFELRPLDDMKIRVLQPPLQFDDKGNPKKYTAKELKELKGEENLPGYTADKDSLQANQTVLVVLVRKKPAAPAKKDAPEDGLADDKPLIKIIVVLAEPKPQP